MSHLRKAGLMALAFFALTFGGAATATADVVSFSTLGCFGAGCTPSITTTAFGSGSASVVFSQQSPTTVNTSTPSGFTVADLGTFTVAGMGTYAPTPFVLQIVQTVPTFGTGTFTATLTGTLIVNGSDARIVFDQTSLLIGTVRYDLANLTFGNTLFLDPNATSGITRITALVSTPAAVPEPATMLLLGTGLAGIAATAHRRRKA